MHSIARLSRCFAIVAIAAVVSSPDAQAEITILIDQQGDDVVASYSGSWDVWTKTADALSSGKYIAAPAAFHNLQGGQDQMDTDPMTLSSGTWTDTFTSASSFAGDSFGFTANNADLWAPVGYVAGQSLSGSLTFANTDVVTMGFTPGENGVFSNGDNTINYSVAVPEPTTVGMLAVGCVAAGLGFVRRRHPLAGLSFAPTPHGNTTPRQ